MINAYHDPVLQAAFLRSVRPAELLGLDRARAIDAIQEVLFLSADPALRQSALLAAEHGLAAVEGKYPLDLRPTVREAAERVLRQWNSPSSAILRTIVALHSLQLEGAV